MEEKRSIDSGKFKSVVLNVLFETILIILGIYIMATITSCSAKAYELVPVGSTSLYSNNYTTGTGYGAYFSNHAISYNNSAYGSSSNSFYRCSNFNSPYSSDGFNWLCFNNASYSSYFLNSGITKNGNSLFLTGRAGNIPSADLGYYTREPNSYRFCFTVAENQYIDFDITLLSNVCTGFTVNIDTYSNGWVNVGTLNFSADSNHFRYEFKSGVTYRFTIVYSFRFLSSTPNYTNLARLDISDSILDSNDIRLSKYDINRNTVIETSWKLQDGMAFPYSANITYTYIANGTDFSKSFSLPSLRGGDNTFKCSVTDLVGYDYTNADADIVYISHISISWQNIFEPISNGIISSNFEFYLYGQRNNIDDNFFPNQTYNPESFNKDDYESSDDFRRIYVNIDSVDVYYADDSVMNMINQLVVCGFYGGVNDLIDIIGSFDNLHFQGTYSTILGLSPVETTTNKVSTYSNVPILFYSDGYTYPLNSQSAIPVLFLSNVESDIFNRYSSAFDEVIITSFITDYLYPTGSTYCEKFYYNEFSAMTDKYYNNVLQLNLNYGFDNLYLGLKDIMTNQGATFNLMRDEFYDINRYLDSFDSKLGNLGILSSIDSTLKSVDSKLDNLGNDEVYDDTQLLVKLDSVLSALNNLGGSGGSDNEIDTPQELGFEFVNVLNVLDENYVNGVIVSLWNNSTGLAKDTLMTLNRFGLNQSIEYFDDIFDYFSLGDDSTDGINENFYPLYEFINGDYNEVEDE